MRNHTGKSPRDHDDMRYMMRRFKDNIDLIQWTDKTGSPTRVENAAGVNSSQQECRPEECQPKIGSAN